MLRITFLGGADEVGGSSILIEMAGRRVLVDAGIRPSPKARWGLAGDQLPHLSQIHQAGGIDAVLVTHAHTDHTGALELVAGLYPQIPFYATPITITLTRVLHQDSRRIMQTRLEEEGELPLFDDVAVSGLLSAFVPVPVYTRLPLADGLVATFYPAGHIAGAAMVGLESDEGRVLISGDVSISPQRTVDGARPPPFRPDVLILESTYGGRLHANRAVQERLLVKTVGEVVEGGGKVLIPAFALGRAQELLLILGEFLRRGELSPVPVWADGMVRAICQAYTSFPDALPLPLQERGAQFFDGQIRPVETGEQRNALVWQTDPAVIISSSGMLAGGPSLSYARSLAGKPQHAILLTGYQDEESPGRRLQELAERGSGTLRLGKDKVDVQCRIGTYSLSAHADEGQLVSLSETLDPQEILLVHGDDAARASLAKALKARYRRVGLPNAGQTLEFRFGRKPHRKPEGIGGGDPVSIPALWKEVAAPAGGLFLIDELARAWWGEAGEKRGAELKRALDENDLYFTSDPGRPDLYRARTPEQVELTLQRRKQMADLPGLPGKWLALRGPGGQAVPARCVGAGADRLQVWTEDGVEQLAWPEDVLAVIGDLPPSPDLLAALSPVSKLEAQTRMEPNQALAFAGQHFPAEARLRRCGYRLEQNTLILTFDFPDAARERYGERIEALQAATGWQVEVAPEASQEALKSLAGSVLPSDWQILKIPAIYREQKQVALTASVPPAQEAAQEASAALDEARRAFRETSGYDLVLNLVNIPAANVSPSRANVSVSAGERLEINAAYAIIKEALAGSTLYRTSLKGDEILLSFISPQVGERYRSKIEALAERVGWKLGINPQANQGAIVEAVRTLAAEAGWTVQKGPSLYPERAEVVLALANSVEEQALNELGQAVLEHTGYRLVVNQAQQPRPVAGKATGKSGPAEDAVEIPVGRVRLTRYSQSLALDPVKLAKTVERARWSGQVAPPIRVRRLSDGYLLLDGLYRLRAAQELGQERILAVVE